jgi:nitrogen fixation NifU-like protein
MSKNGLYTKRVMEHFKNPHNYGRIKNADGVGKVGNAVCGDVMHLYIKIGRDKNGEEIIRDVKFETYGCVAAISTSSIITDLAKGRTLKEAIKIDSRMVSESLGGLPLIKMHCSLLAVDALSEAIYDYLSKEKKPIPKAFDQKHRQIEKKNREVEERYKKWSKG